MTNTNTTAHSEKTAPSTQSTDDSTDSKEQQPSPDYSPRRRKGHTTSKPESTTATHDFPDDTLDLAEQYKDLQHYTDSSNHHPIPSLPPVPHHAPPEDTSELLSPWWSEEPPDVTECESDDHSNHTSNHTSSNLPHNVHDTSQQQQQQQQEGLSHFLVNFRRQATDKKTGKDLWEESCYLWTKEPQQQAESNLIHDIKAATGGEPSNTKHTYPLNSQCAMVCLFRESQERKAKKRQAMNLSSSWNPFYGNWLVVAWSRASFSEHIKETDITKKNSPDYYTVELGERLGRTGEDVSHFMTRTFTPVQELGRRYIESWKDGTQVGFFSRFLASAQRGDAFYLLWDSARRAVDNMMDNSKKNDDDDHKR